VLKKLGEKYHIFIFVGHGVANRQYPDRSYLDLSVKISNTSRKEIVRLSMADLSNLPRFDAQLVMLIGCETASGKIYRGTGASGLHQSFLSLGARTVLGNLWEVDASYAIPQAQRFLERWISDSIPTAALRDCQLATIQSLENDQYYRQPHPYFWGSYVLMTAN